MMWRTGQRPSRISKSDFSRALRSLNGACERLAILRYRRARERGGLRVQRTRQAPHRGSVRHLCTLVAFPPLLFFRLRKNRHRFLELEQVPLEGGAGRPGPLEAQLEVRDDAVVVRFQGEVDIFTAPLFRRHLLAAIGVADRPHIIADVRDVTYLDASGLRVLDECYTACQQNGRHFVVVVPRNVRRLIELVGMDKNLGLADTEERALRLLQGDT
jgi:anti-sigma B factor antagonist